MPQKIKVLPENISNMIAAGEVVERPASVVKELTENAIDAMADQIDITCGKSGKTLIRVSDNGYGMEYDDALLSLERHATSKICSEKDLDSIKTLGFRGEALPSIASVSEMILTTRTESAHAATRIFIKYGTVMQVTKAGSPGGTIVEVKNLFSNLPARAKFLRSAQTELTHIVQAVIRQSIPRPDISFKLSHDGHTLLHLTRAMTLRNRLSSIVGHDQMYQMLEIEGEENGVSVKGFISGMEMSRSNLNSQYIYVNKRFIKSPVIQKAIHNAYHPRLPMQRHPLFCLLIDIDPGRIDFNVHPAKLEIKFDEPSQIVNLINSVVKKSLNRPMTFTSLSLSSPQTRPVSFLENTTGSFGGISSIPAIEKEKLPAFARERPSHIPQRPCQTTLIREKSSDFYSTIESQPAPEKPEPAYPEKTSYKTQDGLLPCGPCIQLDNTYIVYEAREGLIIIDQHAAHERINYEKVKSAFLSGNTPAQTLISHPLINVSPEEDALMGQAAPLLKELGFSIEPFGLRTYKLRSVPVFLNTDPAPVLQAVIQELMENGSFKGRDLIIDPLAATIACHLSVKANQPLKQQEINQLISDLLASEDPYSCPHGRPTLFRLTIKDIEKNFRR
ncbi:DNA mismatch repair endonuclease MutL [bacterium]|nr:DNA mismatch repair endonuclease MutL [bacterium]